MTLKRETYTRSTFHQKLYGVIKEVFILKLASALETGPKMGFFFGFDIIVYD
jgi:hypothetical protein